MSWIKKRIASLSLVILSCIFGVILIEVTLRIIVSYDPWSKTREANILRNVYYKYNISNTYENNSSIVDYVRNKYGLRDSCATPSEIDILTIGGSTTDQRYVSFDNTYQSIIERRLKTYINDFGCVSNAGVDGHSTWGHLFSFEHWFPIIPNLRPKFIVLYIGINDVNLLRKIPLNSGYEKMGEHGIKSFFKNFEIVKSLLPLYRFLKQKTNSDSPIYAKHKLIRYSDDDYVINVINNQTEFLSKQNTSIFRSRMQSLMEHISSLGAIPVCITQPHRYIMKKNGQTYGIPDVLGKGFSGIDFDYSLRKLNDVIFELCKKNTLDLYNHQFLSIHFYDGVHTTSSGSREIGERIAEFIIARFFKQ